MKNRKLVIKVTIGIAVLIVIVLATIISLLVWDPFWSPFRPSPKKILKESSAQFIELKAFHFDVFFEKEAKRPGRKNTKNSMFVSGDLDNTDREELKWTGKTENKADFDRGQFSSGWEKIIIGENSWFKLTSFPSSQFLDFLSFNPEEIKDQWIKVEKDNFKDLFGKLSAQSELEVMKKTITNEGLFRFKKVLPDEKIHEKETYHYLFELQSEEFEKLVPEISKLLPIDSECLGRFKEMRVEVWVGKEDKLIYMVKLESEANVQELDEIMAIRAEIRLSEFNTPLEIKPPQQFKLFEDIFETKDFNFFSFPEQF